MGDDKFKIHNTELDNLISNLRGEVGEVIITWRLFLQLKRYTKYLYTGNLQDDSRNQDIALLEILVDKLEDEIISRLSELSEDKIGQLTFYFAQRKLEKDIDISEDVKEYKNHIEKKKLKEKRNQFISHKQLPEKWTDHKYFFIPVSDIGKCLSLAVMLMIRIDKFILGPSAIYLWREVLKKKTAPLRPLNVNFMLLPHMNLSKEIRGKVILKELEAGLPVWEVVKTKVNGVERDVVVCKKWGAIIMRHGEAMIFDDYPLIELNEINFGVSNGNI